MELILTSDSHLDVQGCTFVDPQRQHALYSVHSKKESLFASPHTLVNRLVGPGIEQNVGVVEWAWFGKANVRWPDGRLVDSKDLLDKHGLGR